MDTTASLPMIFLSSTYVDLREYRQKIIYAIGVLKYLSLDMEHTSARAESTLESSLRDVARANIFVGVIGNWYGEVDPHYNCSISEAEYDRAVALQLPRLMFVPDANHPPALPLPRPPTADEEQRRWRLVEKVKHDSIVYRQYSDANDLPVMIATSLANYISERELTDGTNELRQRRYVAAIGHLARATDLHPNDGRVAFCYALALLQGRDPGSIREKGEIIRIEELLRQAMIGLRKREVVAFWGALKESYWYKRWAYEKEHIEALELFRRAQAYPSDVELRSLLETVQPDIMRNYGYRI